MSLLSIFAFSKSVNNPDPPDSGIFPGDLTGLTLSLCGDSITFAAEIPYNYEDFLQANLPQLTYINRGMSGETMASSSPFGKAGMLSFVQASLGSDIISVFAGTNDYGYALPLGNIDDTNSTTVRGAVNSIINTVRASGKILFFALPMTRQIGSDGQIHDYLFPNSRGLTIQDYSNAIKEICILRQANYLDLYNVPGLMFSPNDWNYDGLHPNSTGMTRIGQYFLNYMTQ